MDSMNVAYITGMAYSNVGLGLVHGMAHPLGGRLGVAHGVANMSFQKRSKRTLEILGGKQP